MAKAHTGTNHSARLPRDGDAPKLRRDRYEKILREEQRRLQRIQQAYLHTGDRVVVALEGYDAAGKGGAIRRMSAELDPRSFKVWPIAAPNEIERQQHYLQRFWSRMPERGHLAVFDRSWYGRVLVERVEGLAPQRDWMRAYREINEFERQLVDSGTRVIKIFLHVSHDVQFERLRERLRTPRKRWKLTYEDFRNRERRADYDTAVADMLEKTSTDVAPWSVIAADHKLYARVETLRCIADAASKGIDLTPPPVPEALRDLARRELGIEFDG
jgi:polyphosphate kinase 2 (PPK2 family)